MLVFILFSRLVLFIFTHFRKKAIRRTKVFPSRLSDAIDDPTGRWTGPAGAGQGSPAGTFTSMLLFCILSLFKKAISQN